MGACSFINSQKSSSAQMAFTTLAMAAEFEYGHSPYNGTISTCKLGRCTLKLNRPFNAETWEEIQEHIESKDYGQKWVADYVEVTDDTGETTYVFYGFAAE